MTLTYQTVMEGALTGLLCFHLHKEIVTKALVDRIVPEMENYIDSMKSEYSVHIQRVIRLVTCALETDGLRSLIEANFFVQDQSLYPLRGVHYTILEIEDGTSPPIGTFNEIIFRTVPSYPYSLRLQRSQNCFIDTRTAPSHMLFNPSLPLKVLPTVVKGVRYEILKEGS